MDDVRDLERKLAEWRAADLLTADQTARILEHERAALEPRPRTSALAEVLGYLGGALALVAAIVLASDFWTDLGTGGRLAVVGATSALLGVGAHTLGRTASGVIQRLSDFLFVLATAGLGLFAGLVADDLAGMSGSASFSIGASAAAVVSLLLWRMRRSPVRHLAAFASIVVTTIALPANLEHLEGGYHGLAIWAVGLAWGAGAWSGAITPMHLGLGLGSSAMVLGAIVASFGDLTIWTGALGLGTAAGLVTTGVALNSVFVLGAGTVAVFILVPRVVFDAFGDSAGGAFALLVSGLALVAAAIGTNRLGRKVREAARREAATRRSAVAVGPAHRRLVVSAALALLAIVAVIVVVVGHTPPPSFPPVSTADPAPPGTVAFQRWEDEQVCIYTVPAAGGTPQRVTCGEGLGNPLAWTSDGMIAVIAFGVETGVVQVFDPATGEIVRTARGIEAEQEMIEAQTDRTLFEGLQVEPSFEGAGITTRRGEDEPQVVISIDSPRWYGLWDLQWSPDGGWFLAVDSETRLVVVAADGTRGPFELVRDANSPAWFIPGVTTFTVVADG